MCKGKERRAKGNSQVPGLENHVDVTLIIHLRNIREAYLWTRYMNQYWTYYKFEVSLILVYLELSKKG